MSTIDEIIFDEYTHLNNKAFFDYETTSPVSKTQINKIKTIFKKIQPSPHSSEEQSIFDRSTFYLRENIADLFFSNQLRCSVVIFPTREAALDLIFESFPWNGYKLVVDDDFIDISCSKSFLDKYGVTVLKNTGKLPDKSVFCFRYDKNNVPKKDHSGSNFFVCDSTRNGCFDLPNLSNSPFDFTLLNLKQVCGADVCVLVLREVSADKLVPFFYGGGAIRFSCATTMDHENFESHSKRFENGTPSMLPIFSACGGIELLKKLKKVGNFSERAKDLCGDLESILRKKLDIVHRSDYTIKFKSKTISPSDLYNIFIQNNVYFTLKDDYLLAEIGIASHSIELKHLESVVEKI